MKRSFRIFACTALLLGLLAASPALADSGQSTRITDPTVHAEDTRSGYPYRETADYVLKEIDARPGDTVLDLGAGDGFWSDHFGQAVGEKGTVHAAEVSDKLLEKLKDRFADTPQVKPYKCPLDGTGLEEDTCDAIFLSKVYHHLNHDTHIQYLGHLRKVAKPYGRLIIIEGYPALQSGGRAAHGWPPGKLIQQAAEAGWVVQRCELMTGQRHFIAIFADKDSFTPVETEQAEK